MSDTASVPTVQSYIKHSRTARSSDSLRHNLYKYRALYLMALPGMLWYVIFKYIPLAGSIIAFQEYDVYKGIFSSKFIGFKHFAHFFRFPEFWQIFTNTALMGLYDIVIAFPVPIILALLMNEVRSMAFKRTVQTAVYVPHFLSWIIIGDIFANVLSPSTGLVNHFIKALGFEPIYFLAKPEYIRGIIIGAGIWRDAGWGTIIYLAAIAGIDPSIYEAAEIDGATRIKQILHITMPSILPIILTMLLLKIGHFLDFGFERTFVFMNGMNQEKADIFDTYVYRAGLQQLQYSYTTAIGLFKSVIGLALLYICNSSSKKLLGKGIV